MKNMVMAAVFLSTALTFNNAMSASDVRVPDIEGKEVLSGGAKIGDVDRVATTGGEVVVIIGLKDDTKEVAVPLSAVTVAADGTVSTSLTKEQLESYEDVDPLDYEEVN